MSEQRIRTIDWKERGLDDAVIDKFASGLRGQLLRRGDPGYDAARKVWNGMVDKRPALIARCAGTSDVVDAVRFAREHDLLVSVRGGGHNYAGKSVSDGGLMIDLGSMKGIQIDPARRTVQAQAGLRLGEFDRETQAFGLATTLGVNIPGRSFVDDEALVQQSGPRPDAGDSPTPGTSTHRRRGHRRRGDVGPSHRGRGRPAARRHRRGAGAEGAGAGAGHGRRRAGGASTCGVDPLA